MKNEELDKLIEKAKTKEDGVYAAFGMYYYGVKDNYLHLIGNRYTGEVLQLAYGFLCVVAPCNNKLKLKTELKERLKSV